LSASVQRQANAISARRVALDEKQYADSRDDNASKAIQELAGEAVWDTTAGVDNKGWLFKPGLDKSEKVDVRKKLDANSALLDILKAAADLSAEIGPRYNGLGKDYWSDADKARHDQLVTSALKTMQKEGSGLSSTDNEYKQYEKMLQPDTLLNKKKFGQLAGQLIQIRKNNTESTLSTYTIEMPETTRQALIASGFAPSKFSHDNIGKGATGAKEGYAVSMGEIGTNLVEDAKDPELTNTQDSASNIKEKKNSGTTALEDLGEDTKQHWDRFFHDKYYNQEDYSDKMVGGADNRFVEMKNIFDSARAGDEEALTTLIEFAGRTKEDTLGAKFGVVSPTVEAGMAKYFLDNLGVDAYSNQFAKNYGINREVSDTASKKKDKLFDKGM
jgi:hypothetical protein